MFHVVLIEPQIPQNTGNIARTCAATGAKLHLVEPLGFSLEDKYLKRSGLDYWEDVEIEVHRSFEEVLTSYRGKKFYFSTTKTSKTYADFHYEDEAFLVFGKETAGISEEILVNHKETCMRIPMRDGARSLNLSNAVAIVLFEALRQNDFPDLAKGGRLHRLSWD